jgi:hypothetical protein
VVAYILKEEHNYLPRFFIGLIIDCCHDVGEDCKKDLSCMSGCGDNCSECQGKIPSVTVQYQQKHFSKVLNNQHSNFLFPKICSSLTFFGVLFYNQNRACFI